LERQLYPDAITRQIIERKASKQGHTYLVINESSKGKEIEEVCEDSPDVGIAVFAQTFIIKAVYLSNLPRLMVST